MTPRSKKWFDDAIRNGINAKVAYFGSEVIDSWDQFWAHKISEENLKKMLHFALSCPEAALHRWSIMAGPRPWIPDDTLIAPLKANPKYSICDDIEKTKEY